MSDDTDLNTKLDQIRLQMTTFNEMYTSLQGEQKQVRTEIIEHQAIVNKLSSKSRDLDTALYDIKRNMREAEKLLNAVETEAKQEEENKKLRAEFERLQAELTEQAKKYDWYKSAYHYQLEGAQKIALAKRVILGDKRGLGKTLTVIASLDLLKAKKILAIVPNDVMENFLREVKRWASHRNKNIIILSGKPKIQREIALSIIKNLTEAFVILNYESWRKDFNLIDQIATCQFDTVIADEAHIVKETSSVSFRGVKDIVYAENQCSLCGSSTDKLHRKGWTLQCIECKHEAKTFGEFCSVKNVIPMTGTPILNKPQDMWSLLHLIDRVEFNDKRDFLYAYCKINADQKWVFQDGGLEALSYKLRGKYIARDRKQAGIKIPKQEIQYYSLKLTPEEYPLQWEASQILNKKAAFVVQDMLSDEGNKAVSAVAFAIALITRKRQMMTWPAGIEFKDPKTKEVLFKCSVEESIKIDRCITSTPVGEDNEYDGLIPQLIDEGERVVLFSQFKQPLIELERRLKQANISVVRYDGDTPKSVANEVQIDFDASYCRENGRQPKWQVVLANYKKGGVGLNFTDATQMIILDEEWNPGKNEQAYGRIDRLGQTEETTVHVLRIENSIDTWMAGIIDYKFQMVEGFEEATQHTQITEAFFEILKNGGLV